MNRISKPLRKGAQAHIGILDAYMSGLNLKDGDRFVVFDLVPNRCGPKT